MVTSRYYRVAELTFGLTAEEQVFDWLPNYAPFETAAQAADLFHLSISNEKCPVNELPLTPFFTDQSEEDMPRIELYDLSDQWLLCVSMYRDSETCCRILASRDWTKATLYLNTPQQRFAIDNAAMLLFAFTSCFKDALTLHASVILYQGKGFFFLGKSGTGKSTHSRQWLSAFPQAELMNDDNPILRLIDGTPFIFGSPWSGKTPCYKAISAPVQGIAQLKQAPQNSYERLRLPAAYAYLLSSSSGLKILPDVMDALYNTLATLVQAVPVILLSCLPNEAAALLCYTTLNISRQSPVACHLSPVAKHAFFFDMDGVLLDSMANHAQAWSEVLREHNIPYEPYDCYLNEGCTSQYLITKLAKQHHIDITEEDILTIYEQKTAAYRRLGGGTPMRDMDKVLHLLKERKAQIWVVTGGGQKDLYEQLERFYPGVFQPSRMITAMDVTEGKPSPEPYLKAWERSGCSKQECCVIENAPLGIRSAKAAGLFTIGVNTGILQRDDLASAGADIVLDNMQQLYEILDTKHQTQI